MANNGNVRYDGEIPSQTLCDEPNPVLQQNSRRGRFAILENMASSQILLMLLDILHEYLLLNDVDERASLKRQVLTVEDMLIDVNNNLATKSDNHDFSANRKTYSCKYQQTIACNTGDFANIDERIHKNVRTSNNRSNVKNCLESLGSDCYPSYIPEESVTVLRKNIGSSMKETQDKAICYPVIDEKSRKSSYRDINNDGCTEKISLPRCDLMCHLRKQKDSPTEWEKRIACKSKCLGDKVQLSVGSAESFPLLISDKQGLIEIHVSQLQLSTLASKISGEEDLRKLYIYISWDIWNEKTAYTMAMSCSNLNFNFSSVYRIADLFSFFKNVLLEYLIFRVNVVRQDNTRYMIARARVSIKDILDYPQNKLHYIVPVNSVISCTYGVNFGQLSLWVRLSCDVEIVEVFKEQCGIVSLRDTALRDAPRIRFPAQPEMPEDRKDSGAEPLVLTNNQYFRLSTDSNSLYETDNENNYVTSNNEEFSSTPVDETNEIFEEKNGRCAIRKRPDSEVAADDRKKIPKDHAMEESPNIMEFKNIIANKSEKDTIIIEIVSVLFFDDSSVIRNDEIRLIFVEYSFLGHYGEDMETVSMEKPRVANQEIVFNFRRKFRIDEKKHTIERNTLCAMLTEYISPNIKFVVVSEPLPEETSIKECMDIGYATFNIRKYALGNGYKDISLPIKDEHKEIGILKIVILGFDAIKQCLVDIKTNNLR